MRPVDRPLQPPPLSRRRIRFVYRWHVYRGAQNERAMWEEGSVPMQQLCSALDRSMLNDGVDRLLVRDRFFGGVQLAEAMLRRNIASAGAHVPMVYVTSPA
eukprot:TRINITY_DN573_c0_g1_i6.p4 TRINITY_DN573_c0_g1~~TRINITY_DN573_c0_g1_i6.p4  ORF type:complete len:101 (+),score=13.92 TRINITY_DN573_c0_g1_i6:1219-1521(+)